MYFVTTLRILNTIVDDCRTVGYFSSYGEAYRLCMENAYDIFENGYYQYAFNIERALLGANLYQQGSAV